MGCKSKPAPPVAILARVGEKILSDEEVKAWESYLPNDKLTPELRSSFIRNWVEKELLVNAARERGLQDDPWVESRVDEIHRELLTARLLEVDAATQPPPSTKEILEYYNRHANEFIWKNLHLDVTYWRAQARAPLDRLRANISQNRPSPLFPSEIATIDSGHFEIDDPSLADPIALKHFGWMGAGQLGYPVLIRGTHWMFKMERRDEAGTVQKLEDVIDIVSSRLAESARLERRNQIVRTYAEKYRKEGRLQWIESGVDTAYNQH